jgi:hypothetical protein
MGTTFAQSITPLAGDILVTGDFADNTITFDGICTSLMLSNEGNYDILVQLNGLNTAIFTLHRSVSIGLYQHLTSIAFSTNLGGEGSGTGGTGYSDVGALTYVAGVMQ